MVVAATRLSFLLLVIHGLLINFLGFVNQKLLSRFAVMRQLVILFVGTVMVVVIVV